MISFEERLPDNTVRRDEKRFDAAILALGFGKERDFNLRGEVSYWAPDRLDSYRDDEQKELFYVSGIGDGGLIDCIRLLHKEIDGGRLLVRLMAMLRHNKYSQPPFEPEARGSFVVSDIEDRTRRLEQSVEAKFKGNDPERGRKNVDFGTKIENEIATILSKGYREIASMLPGKYSEMLDKSFYRPDRVRLIGSLVAPFSPTTEPINKLLIAHALNKKSEIYEQGRVERRRTNPAIRRPDGSWDVITADRKVVNMAQMCRSRCFSRTSILRQRAEHIP